MYTRRVSGKLKKQIEIQVDWYTKGIPTINDAYPIVKQFFDHKMLKGLGYRFDGEKLETWEVEAYIIIENRLNVLRDRDAKKTKSRKR